MTLPNTPRGRHWANRPPARDAADPNPRDRFPTERGPMNTDPVPSRLPPADDPGDHLQVIRVPAEPPVARKRPVDLVVPRVYLEPDERLDSLRRVAFRWAIARDVLVCVVAVWLIGQFVVRPLVTALGF